MKTEFKLETCMQTGCGKMATDLQMTVLQNEATGDSDIQLNDEVEELSKSLREVTQDQTVQPKLQCLMMDPSFSMVTVQSEDSGIMWETSFSRCSNPWTSETSTRGGEVCFSKAECRKIATSRNAGKIVFIMDEAHTVRKKKVKARMRERVNAVATQDLVEVTDRPAMVEVSMPNMKDEQDKQVKMTDSRDEKERRLFRLVSEGSEILNIVVPPKVATVDEEESKDLVDNLAYMEEPSTVRAHAQPVDIEGHANCPDMDISEQTDTQTKEKELQEDIAPVLPFKLPHRGTINDTDYFDMFTELGGHSVGGFDKKEEKQHQPHNKETKDVKTNLDEPFLKTKMTPKDPEDPISSGEIASELLDEVFYGGTADHNYSESEEGCQGVKDELPKSPRKESGCALFCNEDVVLTPIFLSPGPPKIIDPSLLEEPKAMAFLYTDLYEEAVGTRKKEEDAVSMTSEKSFHSKESESDGYLEKFVLKDETPLVEMAEAPARASKTEGFRMWTEEMFELAKLNQLEKEPEKEDPEEEITDFFRDSNRSSPYEDVEQPHVSLEESIDVKYRRVQFEDEVTQKNKDESKSEQAPELTQDPVRRNSLEKALEETGMTETEKLFIDKRSPEDDISDINIEQRVTGKGALVSHKSDLAPEIPRTFAEQPAISKSLGSSLELTSLEPAEMEDLKEESRRQEVETECHKEEERYQRTPPVTAGDTNVPPNNFTDPEEFSSDPVENKREMSLTYVSDSEIATPVKDDM
ncbi:cardiomyopathy-associated protein 5 [Clupea harengus]|uniref:Cardiomyopathy-associated protein 5 n=1 Tax=Clupea harengus TaxID=7950 RepID=A0A6P3W1C8_CLUHA|nr:cardiomyopathy-associated protein 5 [Clupea harengus]